MPSFELYNKMISSSGSTGGQIRKSNSDDIMEATWWEDIQSRVCYLYDYYHDDEKLTLRDLNSDKSPTKISIDAKYIVDSYQTFEKDSVTYHLQFRPSQECNIPYYDEMFKDKYDSLFPIGLFVDIPDEKGRFNKWMIVDKANYYNPQFITYQILPCDHVFQWVHDGKKYQMCGVSRSQNS